METNDRFRERIRREQRLTARLRLATERLEDAQPERSWAVVEAHQSGLSIREIAAATGLSSSRVHQPPGPGRIPRDPPLAQSAARSGGGPLEGSPHPPSPLGGCPKNNLSILRVAMVLRPRR